MTTFLFNELHFVSGYNQLPFQDNNDLIVLTEQSKRKISTQMYEAAADHLKGSGFLLVFRSLDSKDIHSMIKDTPLHYVGGINYKLNYKNDSLQTRCVLLHKRRVKRLFLDTVALDINSNYFGSQELPPQLVDSLIRDFNVRRMTVINVSPSFYLSAYTNKIKMQGFCDDKERFVLIKDTYKLIKNFEIE